MNDPLNSMWAYRECFDSGMPYEEALDALRAEPGRHEGHEQDLARIYGVGPEGVPKGDQVRAQIREERERRKEANKRRLPFISDAFSKTIKISAGFTLIGGVTGKGKTTTLANLVAGALPVAKAPIVVITSEETVEDVYSRIACLQLNASWSYYRAGQAPKEVEEQVEKRMDALIERVEVIGKNSYLDPTVWEDTRRVLERLKKTGDGYAAIFLDYHQAVSTSNDPTMKSWDVSKKFGAYCKNWVTESQIPLVDFVQLRANPPGKMLEFKARVENDTTLANHATMIIEVQPDFKARESTFFVHKDRYGSAAGESVVAKFVHGRLVTA